MSGLTWRGKLGLAMVMSPPLLGVGTMLWVVASEAPLTFTALAAAFAWFGAGFYCWFTGVKP